MQGRRKTTWRLATAVSFFAVGAVFWYGARLDLPEVDARERPNVIVIVVETLRADHLRAYGYARHTMPNLEDIAEDGFLFERATATAPWTLPSVASVLTGLPPGAHGVTRYEDLLPDHCNTLAERFQQLGYHTGFLGVNSLFEAGRNLEQGFDLYYGTDEISAEELNQHLLAWLHDYTGEKPVFLYVHYFDPHCRYAPPEDYHEIYWPAPDDVRTGRTMSPWQFSQMHECYQLHTRSQEPILDVDYYLAQYDAELRHADALMGVFLERLRNAGLYDSSLIFVLGDHGEEFYEHDGFGHGRVLYEEAIRVPLAIKPPHSRGARRRVREWVSTVDIFPTALSFAGIPTDPSGFGIDLRPFLTGTVKELPARAVFSETDYEGQQRSVTEGRWKLIISPDGSRPEGLFDLNEDPGERQNVSLINAVVRDRLRNRLERHEAAAAAVQEDLPKKKRPLADSAMEKLRKLGYVQ